jgi:hypothetical protein
MRDHDLATKSKDSETPRKIKTPMDQKIEQTILIV